MVDQPTGNSISNLKAMFEQGAQSNTTPNSKPFQPKPFQPKTFPPKVEPPKVEPPKFEQPVLKPVPAPLKDAAGQDTPKKLVNPFQAMLDAQNAERQ